MESLLLFHAFDAYQLHQNLFVPFTLAQKTGTGYLESWVYHVVQSVINVNEGVTEEHGMADLFQRMFDPYSGDTLVM